MAINLFTNAVPKISEDDPFKLSATPTVSCLTGAYSMSGYLESHLMHGFSGQGGSPVDQVSAKLREMQQNWEAAAQLFHAQQQAMNDQLSCYSSSPSPAAASPSPSKPDFSVTLLLRSLIPDLPPLPHESDDCNLHLEQSAVLGGSSPYSPGELLAQSAGQRFDGSDCNSTDTEESPFAPVIFREQSEIAPFGSPARASTPPSYPAIPMHVPLGDVSSWKVVEAPSAGSLTPAAELPSLGSADHFGGDCRPCAFLHKKGCSNGRECTFCHLCEPGEKKRRAKVLKSGLRRLEELLTSVDDTGLQAC